MLGARNKFLLPVEQKIKWLGRAFTFFMWYKDEDVKFLSQAWMSQIISELKQEPNEWRYTRSPKNQ